MGVNLPKVDSKEKPKRKSSTGKQPVATTGKLGKAIRLPVSDFSDPNLKPSCLEIDFPIAQINALSQREGNAGKPIYQLSIQSREFKGSCAGTAA